MPHHGANKTKLDGDIPPTSLFQTRPHTDSGNPSQLLERSCVALDSFLGKPALQAEKLRAIDERLRAMLSDHEFCNLLAATQFFFGRKILAYSYGVH